MDFWGSAVDVGLRVASLREKRGWTYRDLEERTERAGRRVSVSVLYRIEKGGQEGHPQKVSVDDLVALCRVFGITPDEMLTSAAEIEWREVKRLSGEMTKAFEECISAAQNLYEINVELSTLASGGDRGLQIVLASMYQFVPSIVAQVHPYVLNAIADHLPEVALAGFLNKMLEQDRSTPPESLQTDIKTITTSAELDEVMNALVAYTEKTSGEVS